MPPHHSLAFDIADEIATPQIDAVRSLYIAPQEDKTAFFQIARHPDNSGGQVRQGTLAN